MYIYIACTPNYIRTYIYIYVCIMFNESWVTPSIGAALLTSARCKIKRFSLSTSPPRAATWSWVSRAKPSPSRAMALWLWLVTKQNVRRQATEMCIGDFFIVFLCDMWKVLPLSKCSDRIRCQYKVSWPCLCSYWKLCLSKDRQDPRRRQKDGGDESWETTWATKRNPALLSVVLVVQ